MRIEPIAPSNLSADQRPLYETIRASIASMSGFDAFTTAREDGALLGPFNPWLHEPTIGKAVWDLTEAISSDSKLPPRCRQIAILVTGARFSAAYELYAHTAVALKIGMAKDFVAALVAGEKPVGIAGDEALVYDISALLASGRVLPNSISSSRPLRLARAVLPSSCTSSACTASSRRRSTASIFPFPVRAERTSDPSDEDHRRRRAQSEVRSARRGTLGHAAADVGLEVRRRQRFLRALRIEGEARQLLYDRGAGERERVTRAFREACRIARACEADAGRRADHRGSRSAGDRWVRAAVSP